MTRFETVYLVAFAAFAVIAVCVFGNKDAWEEWPARAKRFCIEERKLGDAELKKCHAEGEKWFKDTCVPKHNDAKCKRNHDLQVEKAKAIIGCCRNEKGTDPGCLEVTVKNKGGFSIYLKNYDTDKYCEENKGKTETKNYGIGTEKKVWVKPETKFTIFRYAGLGYGKAFETKEITRNGEIVCTGTIGPILKTKCEGDAENDLN